MKIGAKLKKMVSFQSTWVDRGNDDEYRLSDNEYDDDDEGYTLIRTTPTIDPLDIEVLEISGAQKEELDEEFDLRKTVILTLQMLGVVFGDVGTSPLYTFDVMFRKSPIRRKEDILGALSLVLYTLLLIPLIKYVFIVLWANDDGEGGTFALYSLICRNAKASLLPSQLQSDTRLSSFQLKLPSPELERSLKIKELFESSQRWKKVLLMLVLFGTSMVIADGVVTPAMSVLSAVNGLKVGISSVEQDIAVMISAAFIVVLFSLQKYVTSKVDLAVGPALFIWFCSLGLIGIFNLAKYGGTVFLAFNPIYMYYFFENNSTQAWMSLGGCLLCVTGSEAMFADLCYFSIKSIKLTFIFLVLPCLMLGYLGQAAYLMKNQNTSEQVFFASVPYGAFWPVFFIANTAALIASRAMITATFSCIKKSMALGCFPRLKVVHPSRKFMGHIYIPVLNWFLLICCLAFLTFFGSINEIGNAYGIAELGVMTITTILVTIIMILIWQINIILIMTFFITFISLELVFVSSVLSNVGDGSWVLLVFAAILFMVMNIWNYGSKLRYQTEVRKKIPMDLLLKLGSNLGTVRAPGLGLVYNELVKGVPAIFGHFLTALPAIHSMIVFVSVKYVPVPVVPPNERFLFRRVCPQSYHMFRCIARYGYKDARKENHKTFEKLLTQSLENFMRREAQELSLASDDEEIDTIVHDEPESNVVCSNGSEYSLTAPLLSKDTTINCTNDQTSEASTSYQRTREDINLERELLLLNKAKELGIVYLLGNVDIRARKDSWFFRKLIINYFYAFLRRNSRRGTANLSIPHSNLMQVNMTYMV